MFKDQLHPVSLPGGFLHQPFLHQQLSIIDRSAGSTADGVMRADHELEVEKGVLAHPADHGSHTAACHPVQARLGLVRLAADCDDRPGSWRQDDILIYFTKKSL